MSGCEHLGENLPAPGAETALAEPTTLLQENARIPEQSLIASEESAAETGAEAGQSNLAREDKEESPPTSEAKLTQQTSHDQALVSSSRLNTEPEEDREEFSGFRIHKRTLPASGWSQEVRTGGVGGRPRRVLSFRHVSELGSRKQDSDRIIIGILFEKLSQDKFGNGETFSRWSFTDLAEPEPRCIDLHLVGDAFFNWRKGEKLASATRGSIFAILNPTLIDAMTKSKSAGFALRVERSERLLKLGECPSLGMCEMKSCNKPCNADRKERFCSMHLNLAYAGKQGRSAVGGNLNAHLLHSVGSKRKFSRHETDENDAEREEAQKRMKTTVALKLDDRRRTSHKANENYVEAVCNGVRPDSVDTSRVPLLGRAFHGKDKMDLDISMLDSEEKSKALRMIEQRTEPEEELFPVRKAHQGSTVKSSAGASSSKSTSASSKGKTSGQGSAAKPAPSLRDLVSQMRRKPVPRRAGVGASTEIAADTVQSSIQKVASPAPDPASCPGAPSTVAASAKEQSHDSPESLLQELEAAGDKPAKVKAVLKAMDALPVEVLHEGAGRSIYDALGRLYTRSLNLDIKDVAMRTRRRWRARFDAYQQTAVKQKSKDLELQAAGKAETITAENEGATNVVEPGPCGPGIASFHCLADNTMGHLLAYCGEAGVDYFFQELGNTAKFFKQFVVERRRACSTTVRLRAKEIMIRDKSASPRLEMLASHLQGYRMLVTLDLSEYTLLPANWTKELAQVMPSTMKNLHLRGCKFLRDASVKRLLSACPRLELLDVLGIPQLSTHALALPLPALRILAAGSLGRPVVAEKHNSRFTGTISTLSAASSAGAQRPAAQSSVKFTSALLRRLARPLPAAQDPAADVAALESDAAAPDSAADLLGGVPLTHLILPNCAEIEALPHLPATLRHLDLRGANLTMPEKAAPTWRPLSSCEQLGALVLHGNDLLSGAALLSCITSLPTQAPLRVLDLSWTRADLTVVARLTATRKLITHLCLAGCPGVGDAELTAALRGLPALEVFDVKRCLAIVGPLSEIARRHLSPTGDAADNASVDGHHQGVCSPNLRYLGVGETALSVDTAATARALHVFAPKATVVTSLIDVFNGYNSLPPDLV